MEIIIIAGIVILAGWYIFFRQPKKSVEATPAPYKVEAPAPVAEEPKVEVKPAVQEAPVAATQEPAPAPAAKKKPAAKKAAPAKTAAKKTAKPKTEKAKPVVKRVK